MAMLNPLTLSTSQYVEIITAEVTSVGDTKTVHLTTERLDELQPCPVDSVKPLVVRWMSCVLLSKFQLHCNRKAISI